MHKKYSIEYYASIDVVEIKIFEEEILLEDVVSMHKGVLSLSSGKRHGILYLAENFLNISREARVEGQKPEYSEYVIAQAFIAHNLALRLMGNFIRRLLPKPKTVKLFKTREEGLSWLLEKLKNKDLGGFKVKSE